MQAVHIRAEGVTDKNASAFAEMLLWLTQGVKDVAAMPSLHLISVLYDERVADLTVILSAIRRAGFRAYVVRPSRSRRARSAGASGASGCVLS